MQRYFAKECMDKLILQDSDIYHIKKVMRMKIGDKIEVLYNNKVHLCEIISISPLEFNVLKVTEEENKLNIDVTIAIGLVKEQKMDLILQKLTELGINTIIPVAMERSIVRLEKERFIKKKSRWESICKEASEQSHRSSIPIIEDIMSIDDLTKIDADLKLLASTKEKNNLFNSYLQNNKKCAKIIMVIGPEGGISEREETILNENGYTSVSFGSLIFRVETAAIYAASIFNYSSMR